MDQKLNINIINIVRSYLLSSIDNVKQNKKICLDLLKNETIIINHKLEDLSDFALKYYRLKLFNKNNEYRFWGFF